MAVFRKILLLVILSISGTILTGCDDLFVSIFSDVSSIEIEEASFKRVYNLDTFAVGELKIIITRYDGSTQRTSVKESMLTTSDVDKLTTEGTHTITIKYRGAQTTIEVVLIKQGLI